MEAFRLKLKATLMMSVKEHKQGCNAFTAQAAREHPQEVLDVLLDLERDIGWLGYMWWKEVERVDVRGLQLDRLWKVLMTKHVATYDVIVCNALARLFGEVPVPSDVARFGKQKKNQCGMILWLLSEETDVPMAVSAVLTESTEEVERLFNCLKVAVTRHQVNIEEHFRRNVARKRRKLWLDVELLHTVGAELDPDSFSREEWQTLGSEEKTVQLLPKVLRNSGRPEQLVAICLERTRAKESIACVFLPLVARWLTQAEAEELIALFDRQVRQAGESTGLGWLLTRPWASLEMRTAVLLKRLTDAGFAESLDEVDAEWSAFIDAQLEEFALRCSLLFEQEAVAKELCRRGLPTQSLRSGVAALAQRKMKPKHWLADSTLGWALCRYAVHDPSLFNTIKFGRALGHSEDDARARIYTIVGRWKYRYHGYLPHNVQRVALVTLWALSKLGTRYIVYMILERALSCSFTPECGKRGERRYTVTYEQFCSVLKLLRK